MKIILIEDVKGTGKKDQVKEVKDGFGNFLVKNKQAVPYTEKSKEVLSNQLEDRRNKEQQDIKECQILKDKLEKTEVKIKVKTGTYGKVFGSISSKQISEEDRKSTRLNSSHLTTTLIPSSS